MSSAGPVGTVPGLLRIIKSLATCPNAKDFPSAISSKYAVNDVLVTKVSLAMLDVPVELLKRRDAFCDAHDVVIQIEAPDWGLDAYLWRTDSETILKVHRYRERFQKELATYRRLAERSITRLKGFQFPQMVDYDEELNILELSIVSPPYILDFVEVGLGKMPGNFDLDRIEAQQSKQFGKDWPDVRRLLEALMQIGIYYDDVHNKNIRFR